jgi:Domain of unknown function (DUF4157)
MRRAEPQSRSFKKSCGASPSVTRRSSSPVIPCRSHSAPTIARCACGGSCPRCKAERNRNVTLAVSQPGDPLEREANEVADKVMRMANPASLASGSVAMQRNGARREDSADRVSEPHSRNLYALSIANQSPSSSSSDTQIVHDVLRLPGQPLDSDTRAFMEPRLGCDFSQVRIHTDQQAAESAQSVGARAYTKGRNVVFGDRQYVPETAAGRRLLAHELAHVVQQGKDSNMSHLQREEARAKGATGPCNVDVLSELDPGALLPSAYFQNGVPLFEDKKQSPKDKYKSALEAFKKRNCATHADFPDITLKWDLGNPKLGSWYTKSINNDSKTFDINNQLIYPRNPCCPCFTGSLTWSFDVTASRVFDRGKKTQRTETGKTANPLVGKKKSAECAGTECCSVNKTLPISLWLGDDDVSIDFNGTIILAGKLFEREA